MDTTSLKINFGKHEGELWTRVPRGYLEWLINQPTDKPEWREHKKIAKAEMKRRGTKIRSTVKVTPHALDKASLRVRGIWHETSKENEGLYTWLSRVADEAVKQAKEKTDRIDYLGMTLVFKHGEAFPILKTVIYKGNKE